MDAQEIRAPDRLALVRAMCFVKVALVGQMKNSCSEEEYQKALSRIRDWGIMNRLTVHDINDVFNSAHDVVV